MAAQSKPEFNNLIDKETARAIGYGLCDSLDYDRLMKNDKDLLKYVTERNEETGEKQSDTPLLDNYVIPGIKNYVIPVGKSIIERVLEVGVIGASAGLFALVAYTPVYVLAQTGFHF